MILGSSHWKLGVATEWDDVARQRVYTGEENEVAPRTHRLEEEMNKKEKSMKASSIS